MALEILKGGVGAMSQNKGDMHMGEALLVLTSWTNLVVVDIPEFPLLCAPPSLLSTIFFQQKQ
ncbi:unnamed protein product [Brassica oleracea var. botrytis]|nr:unnamed protein product [Brassica oleracea]